VEQDGAGHLLVRGYGFPSPGRRDVDRCPIQNLTFRFGFRFVAAVPASASPFVRRRRTILGLRGIRLSAARIGRFSKERR